ncbi:hypothetical protein X798_07813 [Onchocerca flexuosa]|uniref:Uncharacterized protein n=1 Tax=Onchocerca flexuosa TaxID=387005 RepID=A0A238BJK0_9BILA|nr:hypothetical protein X798_07813 [Onchocerca flexuosa]
MDGCRKALYSYSWQQSPINKRRRVNLPDEEKKIFDDWFEEKADEYVPWIRNHGSDYENVHANDFWMTSLSPCNPEIHKILVRVSPRILEPLQRPKQDRKTIKEEMHKETERLTNIIRYEKSLKGTRKTIDVIKKEKRKKPIFFQTQQQRLFDSTVFREYSTCIASDKLSSFREELCDEQVTARMESSVSDSKEPGDMLKCDSILFMRSTSCHNIEECAKQTASSESKQRTPEHHNDNSDNELLRLALESSPISKSDSALKVASNEDELTDEALLAMMLSSPASNPKLKNNRWSADLCQLLS